MNHPSIKRTLIKAASVLSLGATMLCAAPLSGDGELLLGFRATGGNGADSNYVIDLGQVSAFTGATTIFDLPQTSAGVGTDLAALYGSGWHARTDLNWGIAGTVGNISPLGADPVNTLYASKAEVPNGTLATPWNRSSSTASGNATNRINSVRSEFNSINSTPAANAPTDAAVIMLATSPNSWSRYMPGGSLSQGNAFALWGNPYIEGNPAVYLDLFRMEPGSGSPAGELVGRFVLKNTGVVQFVPDELIGKSTIQLDASSYSVAETVATGVLNITVTRTGDLSSTAACTISTTDGTATAPADFTALSSQAVTFAVGETSKVVPITIVNRAGVQSDRSFTVGLGGANASITLGTNASATCTITETFTPSVITLTNTTYSANQGATSVAIGLTRTGGTEAVTFTLSATPDTAQPGSDYTAPTGTVTLPANATTGTATITLLPRSVTDHLQFNISISAAQGGNTIGAQNSAVVRILVADSEAPRITLVSPLAARPVAEVNPDSVTIKANVTDNKEIISRVEVSLNGGALLPATLVAGSYDFVADQAGGLRGGLNSFTIQAFDARNNASTLLRSTFTYSVKRALAITNTPGTGGTVTFKPGAVYEVGKPLAILAKPAAGFVFEEWVFPNSTLTIGESKTAALAAILSDAMAGIFGTGNPIAVTARFKPTPFTSTPSALVAGTYNGLIASNGATDESNSTNGFIGNLVVGVTGAFTATVQIDGISVLVKGIFDASGVARFGTAGSAVLLVPRATKPSYELSLTMVDVATPGNTNTITGTLTQKNRNVVLSVSNILAHRAVNVAAAAETGLFTVAFPAKPTNDADVVAKGLIAADYPQGDGVGSILVDAKGKATLTVTLADGTKVTASSTLSKDRQVSLYAPLYKSGATTAGSFGGLATFSNQTNTDVAGANFFWFRPWLNTHHYPWGWAEGIYTDLVGAKFAVPVGSSILPGLPASFPNATLSFSNGLLASTISKDVTISASNVVINSPTEDKSFKLTLTAAKGTFAGDFTHDSGLKTLFTGAILQKGTNRKGFGHFLTVAPKPITGLGEAGRVELIKK